MLDAQPDTLELVAGAVRVRGNPDAAVRLADVAAGCYMAPAMMPQGVDLHLDVTVDYDGDGGGFSASTHCCWVEVDPETGTIAVPRYLVVEDCGRIIHPAVVNGQIRGGVAMGLSGMLLEEIAFNEEGQCLSGTFMDYLVPTASDIPEIEIEHIDHDADEAIGSFGVGEGATITAHAALVNAVEDATLAAGGRRVTRTPLSPSVVLEMLGVLVET
jgi:carbon-monoxide dehydrogenase large subunit